MNFLKEKLDELIAQLKLDKKDAYKFFESQNEKLSISSDQKEALNNLRTSGSIVQYANFSQEAEKAYDEMYNALEKVLNLPPFISGK